MYTEQVVSFIDILGFKHLIESKPYEEMLEIHDAFYKVNKEEEDYSPEIMGVKMLNFKMINFSDSIVRCRTNNNVKMPHHPIVYELLALLDIQWKLIYSHGVLIRGGVTIGDIYLENATVFGKALNEAYDLESKKAKYPRIIVDESILDKDVLEALPTYDKEPLSDLLKQDSDGYYFINYLNCAEAIYDYTNVDYESFLKKHKEVCEKLLEEGKQEKDEKKRKKLEEKGNWLKEYHNQHISQLSLHPELEYELETTTLELRNKLLIH